MQDQLRLLKIRINHKTVLKLTKELELVYKAKERNKVIRDEAGKIAPPKTYAKRFKAYNHVVLEAAILIEVRQKFLDILRKSDILRPICMTSMFAGLRIGEILALRWKDIDFDNKSINIDYAVTQLPKFDKTGKVISRETVISDTKTAASVREVPMPSILVEALAEWKKTRWVSARKTGISFIEPNDLVFSTNEGKLRTYYGIRAMFERLMRDNGMSEYGIHFHTLRQPFRQF